MPVWGDRRDRGAQAQVDVVLGVPRGRMDIDGVTLVLAQQIALRQRRAFVGVLALLSEQHDGAVEVLFPEGLCCLRTGQAGSDDDACCVRAHALSSAALARQQADGDPLPADVARGQAIVVYSPALSAVDPRSVCPPIGRRRRPWHWDGPSAAGCIRCSVAVRAPPGQRPGRVQPASPPGPSEAQNRVRQAFCPWPAPVPSGAGDGPAVLSGLLDEAAPHAGIDVGGVPCQVLLFSPLEVVQLPRSEEPVADRKRRPAWRR